MITLVGDKMSKQSQDFIKKNAYSFNKLEKKARVAGYRYVSEEFKDIDSEVNDITRKFYGSFMRNERKVVNTDTLKILGSALAKIESILNEYWQSVNVVFAGFKKQIVKNHQDVLIDIFGDQYMSMIEDILPGKSLSHGPKYKAMMELVSEDDRPLLERALNALSVEPEAYGDKYRIAKDYYDKASGAGHDYDWVEAYADLFKFAKHKNSFMKFAQGPDDPEIEIGDEDIILDIDLTASEKNILGIIISMWESYKKNLDKYMGLLDRAKLIDTGYVEIENERHELLASVFDRLRALKTMVDRIVGAGEDEGEFFDSTGLTFKNAYAKLDSFVYRLTMMFPPKVRAYVTKYYLDKMPRKFVPGDAPKWSATEDKFFELGEDYEAGSRSGVEEDGSDVMSFRDKEMKFVPRSFSFNASAKKRGITVNAEKQYEMAVKVLRNLKK